MKKQVRKLTLAKETVRNLNEAMLSEIAGGSNLYGACSTDTYYNSCERFCLDEPIGPP